MNVLKVQTTVLRSAWTLMEPTLALVTLATVWRATILGAPVSKMT